MSTSISQAEIQGSILLSYTSIGVSVFTLALVVTFICCIKNVLVQSINRNQVQAPPNEVQLKGIITNTDINKQPASNEQQVQGLPIQTKQVQGLQTQPSQTQAPLTSAHMNQSQSSSETGQYLQLRQTQHISRSTSNHGPGLTSPINQHPMNRTVNNMSRPHIEASLSSSNLAANSNTTSTQPMNNNPTINISENSTNSENLPNLNPKYLNEFSRSNSNIMTTNRLMGSVGRVPGKGQSNIVDGQVNWIQAQATGQSNIVAQANLGSNMNSNQPILKSIGSNASLSNSKVPPEINTTGNMIKLNSSLNTPEAGNGLKFNYSFNNVTNTANPETEYVGILKRENMSGHSLESKLESTNSNNANNISRFEQLVHSYSSQSYTTPFVDLNNFDIENLNNPTIIGEADLKHPNTVNASENVLSKTNNEKEQLSDILDLIEKSANVLPSNKEQNLKSNVFPKNEAISKQPVENVNKATITTTITVTENTKVDPTGSLAAPGHLLISPFDFTIREPIGQGTGGEVYLVLLFNSLLEQRSNGKKVVAKLFKDENTEVFLQEVAILALFTTHPNISRMIGYEDSTRTILMIFCQQTLRDWYKDVIPKELKHIFSITLGISKGLTAIHESGIAHCDIKPANILLEIDSNGIINPIIADFGVSCVVDNTVVKVKAFQVQNVRGLSHGYAAPEKYTHHFDFSPSYSTFHKNGDQYSFSIIIYEMISNRYAWPLSNKNAKKK